ncbi:MAG: ABC transporter substrate-binding protein [Burkholderiales bacterium]
MLVSHRVAAQPAAAVRRIGVLSSGAPDSPEWLRKEAEPLRELGWVEGRNLLVDRRYDNGRPEALPALAQELVRARVELIVVGSTSAARAAKQATASIPIVFSVGDPVLLGLVASLARPGGNLTGVSEAGPELAEKFLSLIRELLPRIERIGVLSEAGNPYNLATRGQFADACKRLGMTPVFGEIGAAADTGRAIASLVQQRAQAVVLFNSVRDYQAALVAAAAKHGLPTLTEDPQSVRESGALLGYDASRAELVRLRAEYIDRILRGAKPAELPVRQPTKFDLAINLRSARELGIAVPKTLLVRADEVVQ